MFSVLLRVQWYRTISMPNVVCILKINISLVGAYTNILTILPSWPNECILPVLGTELQSILYYIASNGLVVSPADAVSAVSMPKKLSW